MLVGYSGGGHKHAAGCRICDKDEMKKKCLKFLNIQWINKNFIVRENTMERKI